MSQCRTRTSNEHRSNNNNIIIWQYNNIIILQIALTIIQMIIIVIMMIGRRAAQVREGGDEHVSVRRLRGQQSGRPAVQQSRTRSIKL